jgi:hypothetical protein
MQMWTLRLLPPERRTRFWDGNMGSNTGIQNDERIVYLGSCWYERRFEWVRSDA